MTADQHIDIEDLAMYAMLPARVSAAAPESAGDVEPIASHLAECAACRAELAQLREDLALYALTTAPVELPSGARDRFLDQLGAQGAQDVAAQPALSSGAEPVHGAHPVQTGEANRMSAEGIAAEAGAQAPRREDSTALRPVLVERKRSAGATLLPWVGWAVAAASLFVAYGLRQERDSLRTAVQTEQAQAQMLEQRSAHTDRILDALRDPHAVRVSLTQPKAPALPAARASYDQKYGTLLMQASNLAPLETNKVYELWVIPANGNSPIAAGIFTPDAKGNATLVASSLPEGIQAKAFGITIEHAGGSATPTMPILLAGAPG